MTFWINFVHLAQPIKIFYKTKGIYLLIFKNLYYNKKFKGKNIDISRDRRGYLFNRYGIHL